MQLILLLSLVLSVESFSAHVQESSAPIPPGQTLTLQLSAWNIGGSVKIKGTAPDLIAVFELAKLNGEKVVGRWSNISNSVALAQTHGGWPFGPTSRAVKLELTNTATEWEVSVDGKRFPWLDLTHTSAVNTGYEVVNLPGTQTVGYRACTIACSNTECQCGGAECFMKLPGAGARCTSDQAAGACCTGTPPTLNLNTIQEGQVVEVAAGGDSTYITRACASVDSLGACQDVLKSQPSLNGQSLQGGASPKLLVMEKLRSVTGVLTGKVRVYFPVSHAVLVGSPWMFVKSSAVERKVNMDAGAPGVTIDQGLGQVKSVTFGANSGNNAIRFNDYIVKLEQNSRTWQFTTGRLRQMMASNQPYIMVLSDAPRLLPETPETCQNSPGWTDNANIPERCSRYSGQDGGEVWCTKFGLPTPAWRAARCSGGNCGFELFARDGASALDACCACGGGVPTWQASR